MTEAELEAAVEQLAFVLHWRRYHTRDSRRSEPGFPDLMLVRRGKLIAAELKSPTGVVTASQRAWLDDLAAVPGIDSFVWRPEHWLSGEIEAALR